MDMVVIKPDDIELYGKEDAMVIAPALR